MQLVSIILYVILLDSHTRVSRSSGARAQIRLSPSESGGRRRSELPKMQNALPATLQGNMKTGSLAHLLVEELPRASWLGTPTRECEARWTWDILGKDFSFFWLSRHSCRAAALITASLSPRLHSADNFHLIVNGKPNIMELEQVFFIFARNYGSTQHGF